MGGDGLDVLAGVGTLVKSPGVPLEIAVVAEARRRGIGIVDELDIGWRLVAAPTVAVTGTNGKSTVAGLCVSVLGGAWVEPGSQREHRVRPAPERACASEAPRSIVAEVSSYPAECSPALAVEGAIFTNLTPRPPQPAPDDGGLWRQPSGHSSSSDAETVPVAALNADDELGRAIADDVEDRGGRAIRYGTDAGAEYRIMGCRWGLREAEVEIESPDGPIGLVTRLPGAHNAHNAVSVLAMADGLGLPRDPTLAALAAAAPTPGRFEPVDVGRPFDVVVDFAYSLDSVSAVLDAARPVVESRRGRLITVLGVVGRAGPVSGDEVAAAARERSEHLILSGTSYRGEPRLVTLARLAAGARAARGGELEIVIDRRRAIARRDGGRAPGRSGRDPRPRARPSREATDRRGGFVRLDDRQAARELA